MILIAYGDDDTQNYGKAEDSVTFCGCANTGYISPIFGLYSKESQDEERYILSIEHCFKYSISLHTADYMTRPLFLI